MRGSFDRDCPDCWIEEIPTTRYGSSGERLRGEPYRIFHPCGLSPEEHGRLVKARKEAEAQAHELMVQDRINQQLPRAIIKEIYDQAERDVRAHPGR